MVMRLNLSDFERAAVRLRSGSLEWEVVRLCELARAVILNLGGLKREMARLRSDSFEWVVVGLRGLCELAAKPNLDDLEWAAAGLCELRMQMAVAVRLSACGVMWTGVVREAEVEIRVAHRPRKTTHRCLSCMYVAEGGVCRCYVELDACGKSIAAVHLSCALPQARALVAR